MLKSFPFPFEHDGREYLIFCAGIERHCRYVSEYSYPAYSLCYIDQARPGALRRIVTGLLSRDIEVEPRVESSGGKITVTFRAAKVEPERLFYYDLYRVTGRSMESLGNLELVEIQGDPLSLRPVSNREVLDQYHGQLKDETRRRRGVKTPRTTAERVRDIPADSRRAGILRAIMEGG